MDIKAMLNKVPVWAKKYRYVLLVLLLGIALMLLPGNKNREDTQEPVQEAEPEPSNEITSALLADIISKIQGAGKVEVLLTYGAGEKKVYQSNEHTVISDGNSTKEAETVILTDGSRNEEALVSQVLGPEYLGAVVVCQGADDPQVRLAVFDAVAKATGLGADRISVLKMK